MDCLYDLFVFVIIFYTKPFVADHVQEQEMEIEALEAILMDDFQGLIEIHFLFGNLLSRTQNPPFSLVPGNEQGILFSSACAMPEIHSSESGLNTSNRCFQITLSPQVHILLCAISFCVVAK